MLNMLVGILMTCSTVALVVTAWSAGLGWFCPVIGAVGGYLTCKMASDDEDEEDN
jgi:hypothetical protein